MLVGTRNRHRAGVLALIGGMTLLMAGAGLGVGQAQANDEVVFAPHRAVYDITLHRAQGGLGIADMSGRMVYELTGNACIGYSQNMRFVTNIVNQEGETSLTDLRSTSWEDALSRTFRFNSTQYKDRKLTERTVGDAVRTKDSSRLKIALTRPARKQIDLATEAMFPLQHSRETVVRARRGERLFTADLYDGSEKGEKIYTTISFLGNQRPPGNVEGLAPVESAKPLLSMPSWPVSISYYEPATRAQDAVPTYELSFLFYANGVSRRLLIDYGSFAVRGVLKEITFLDPGKCDTPAKATR